MFLIKQKIIHAYAINISLKFLLSQGEDSSLLKPNEYLVILGCLQFLQFTRFDLAFVVNKLAQFSSKLTEQDLTALKPVLRYLQGTIEHGLFIYRDSPLIGFRWGRLGLKVGWSELHRSFHCVCWPKSNLLGFPQAVGHCAVINKSRILCHLECRCLTLLGHKFILWVVYSSPNPLPLYCDNLDATFVCQSCVLLSMKHIEINYHIA